jgi:predicted negative regulator of RcsB-dependent stress response
MSQLDTISQEVPATGAEKFLEDNFRKLVWLFAFVVIAMIAYGFIRHQSTLKANEAAEAFTSAKTVEDCDLVISRYVGTNAAANALLLKADLLWDQNKKTSAVDALKEFTSKNSSHPLFVHTLLGLGTKLDAMGERKEAQAIFERIVNEFASHEAAPLAQVRLGDLLWADGKQDEAKKAYEDLAVKFPDMAEFQSVSQDRLGWIAASLPTKEVDPPPAPKVEPKPGDVPAIPGMPKINLTPGAGGIGATIAPPAMLTPTPAAATTPAAVTAPSPAVPAPTPAVPAPVPTPAPAAPTTPTPAPPATTPPATPAPAAPAPPPPASPATPAPVVPKL